jgi:hypothetical protein
MAWQGRVISTDKPGDVMLVGHLLQRLLPALNCTVLLGVSGLGALDRVLLQDGGKVLYESAAVVSADSPDMAPVV